MHIQELRIQGFRSLRDVSWKPGKLNVLIGPNGSGKSNLLRALELLFRATQGKISEEILQQGGLATLLWDGRAKKISWRLTTVSSEPAQRYEYQLDLGKQILLGDHQIEVEQLRQGDDLLLEQRAGQIKVPGQTGEKPSHLALPTELPHNESLLSLINHLFLLGPMSDVWIFSFRNYLHSWKIFHDMQVDQRATLRQAAVARLEKQVAPDGQNLIPVLHTLYSGNREFKSNVDRSMRAAFGPDYEELVFPPAADQRIQLRIRWKSLKTEQSAADLSDGTLRFLLLLAILANPRPGTLIAVDEPEAGLHPSMFPIIAELAAEAAERTQVILTTHSPQFLDAFTGEPPTTTVAQWDQGETRLSVVDGEELRRWLQEYSLGALFRSGELEALA